LRARGPEHYDELRRSFGVNENLSLIVMCFFLVASLAFLADQILSYH
jgi:hypothetical protein